MSSESELLRWKSEGLPADNLSMQNSVVILNSSLPPLVIDPSTQACDMFRSFQMRNHIDKTANICKSSSERMHGL